MQDISADILIKASEGDLQSFETIYRATAGFVYNVAFRLVNNKEDAEEVTQDVFLIIYRRLKDFRFESSFKTWAYRITVNCAINLVRKISIKKNRTITYDDQSATTAVLGDTQKEIDKEHDTKRIEQLLSVLNPDQRACVVLRNIEMLSYQEIAEVLKININTVRSRLKRAREKLLTLKREGE